MGPSRLLLWRIGSSKRGRVLFQSCQLALCFLQGNEVGIRVLPNIEQLLIAAVGDGLIEMGLSAGSAEQAESVIGSLGGAHWPFLQSQAAVANSRLEIGDGLLPLAHLQRRATQKLRCFRYRHVRTSRSQ